MNSKSKLSFTKHSSKYQFIIQQSILNIEFPTQNSKLKTQKLKTQNSSVGFTLVEVLMTMLITGIALLPIVGLFSGGGVLLSGKQAKNYQTALDLARKKMDEVVNKATGANFSSDYYQPATAFPAPEDEFKYIITDDFGTSTTATLKTFQVTVWADTNGDDVFDSSDAMGVVLDTKVAKRQ